MKAIIELQRKIKLTPDGVFGPDSVRAFARHFGLTNSEAAHLLGQCHHESAGFTRMEENLNYSAERLLQIFPKYFDAIQAKSYANKPREIANKVYSFRMGNGSEGSQDGWTHRGMGPLQLTGKQNQERFLKSVGKTLADSSLIKDELAFESAIWFFRENKIFPLCKEVDLLSILKVSKAVNLGNPASAAMPHGMPDRKAQTFRYFQMLSS